MKKQLNDNTDGADPTRRSFLSKLWIGLGFVAVAEFIAVAFAFLRSQRAKAREEDLATVVTAGVVDRFTPNSVTAFVRGRFYLARLENGGFLALSRKCTQLGCTVPWVEKEMKTKNNGAGCLYLIMNIIWFFIGGIWICLSNLAFGLLFFITIIGIPFAIHHFKLAGLALSPFGKEVINK